MAVWQHMATKPRSKSSKTTLENAVIHKRIAVPLYEGALNVLFTDSASAGARWLAKKFPAEGLDADDYGDTAAFVWTVNRWPWVVLPWDSDASIIAHEAVHAAFEFYNAVGVKTGYSNQEPLAYLVGWIANTLSDTLGDLNIERAKHIVRLRNTEREVAAVLAKTVAASPRKR